MNINQDLLETYRKLEEPASQDDTDFATSVLNGSQPEPEGAPNANDDAIMKGVEKTLSFFAEMFQENCDKNNLPGFKGVTKEEYTELGTFVAGRNFTREQLKKSPEYCFIGMTLGMAGINLMAYQQNKKEQARASQQASKNQEGADE